MLVIVCGYSFHFHEIVIGQKLKYVTNEFLWKTIVHVYGEPKNANYFRDFVASSVAWTEGIQGDLQVL